MAVPTLLELSVQGRSLAFRYSEALNAILPSFNRFVVLVNGRRVNATGPASLSADGTTIFLTLASPVGAGATVSVTYVKMNGVDRSGHGDIKSRSTAEGAAFFSNSTATNRTAAPSLQISSSASALKAGETATISFVFSELPIGFEAGDISTSGGVLTGLSVTADPKVYSATFTPTAGGSGSASIVVATGAYSDAAGNGGGGGTTQITLDPTPVGNLTASLSQGLLEVIQKVSALASSSPAESIAL